MILEACVVQLLLKDNKDLLKQCYTCFHLPGLYRSFCWDLRKGSGREQMSANSITHRAVKAAHTLKRRHIIVILVSEQKLTLLGSSHLEIMCPQQLRKVIPKQIVESRSLACFENWCLPGILNTVSKNPYHFYFPPISCFLSDLPTVASPEFPPRMGQSEHCGCKWQLEVTSTGASPWQAYGICLDAVFLWGS